MYNYSYVLKTTNHWLLVSLSDVSNAPVQEMKQGWQQAFYAVLSEHHLLLHNITCNHCIKVLLLPNNYTYSSSFPGDQDEGLGNLQKQHHPTWKGIPLINKLFTSYSTSCKCIHLLLTLSLICLQPACLFLPFAPILCIIIWIEQYLNIM